MFHLPIVLQCKDMFYLKDLNDYPKNITLSFLSFRMRINELFLEIISIVLLGF